MFFFADRNVERGVKISYSEISRKTISCLVIVTFASCCGMHLEGNIKPIPWFLRRGRSFLENAQKLNSRAPEGAPRVSRVARCAAFPAGCPRPDSAKTRATNAFLT